MPIRTDNIRAIVFDLDRTLIVSQSGFNKALRDATDFFVDHLKHRGELRSRAEVYRTLRPIASSFEKRGLYNRDEWWIILLRKLGLSRFNGPWVHQATRLYWKEYIAASPPYRDAERTVRALHRRRYLLGMVSDTDGTPRMKHRRIRSLPFHDLFQAIIVAGEDSRKIKPDVASFKLVAKGLGVPPEQCAYVGDNPRVDVKGARAIGMQTIIVRRRRRLKGARPDLTISRLSSLLGVYKIPMREKVGSRES